MATNGSTSAQDEPAPPIPRRVWDERSGTWIEACVRRRDQRGRYAKHLGNEPGAQLVFWYGRAA